MENVKCYRCEKDIGQASASRVGRNDECPHCSSYIHCCFMCNFYDKNAYNECREPSADRVVEKEKNNFCDFYVLKGLKDSSGSKDDILAKANSLFKF